MKKLLIILLFIVGCEEPSQHGCFDGQATNYDATASIDNDTCTYIDSCGVIDIDLTNDCVQDTCGVWGGNNACVDDCGIVNGGGYIDCVTITECDTENICDESECIAKDCNGVCGGDGIDSDDDNICDNIDECIGAYDACNVCNGPGKNYICDGSGWHVCDETECPEPYTCSCDNWYQQSICSAGPGDGYNACGPNKNAICIENYPNCSECYCE